MRRYYMDIMHSKIDRYLYVARVHKCRLKFVRKLHEERKHKLTSQHPTSAVSLPENVKENR